MINDVINLNSFINYQEDSVVSKTIVNKPCGTITLFAFDRGQGLSEHTAAYDALVQVIDGAAEIHIDGRLHQVKSGEMVVMPANRPHALHAAVPFKMLLTMIKSE